MAHLRIARDGLRRFSRGFPAVGILGPRQIGKSTLAQLVFPTWPRLDLEDPRDHDRLAADPRFVLEQHRHLVIDEAQRLPELFPVLRVHLDEDPRRRVVLLGSASPSLVRGLSESLTGRIALFEFGPVSWLEHPADRVWALGGFPRLHWARPRPDPNVYYASYLKTVLEQDLPQLGLRLSAPRLRALLTMVASAQGGICNLSEFGSAMGISHHAVRDLLDALEGVFLVRRLLPYFANVGKRLVRAPKVYVRDTGLLHSLLGIGFDRAAILAHHKAGASYETFVLEQVLSLARLADPASEPFYWRTHAGAEVDLLLRLRGEFVPIEIKLGRALPRIEGLRACMRDLNLARGYVVASVADSIAIAPGVRMLDLDALSVELGLRPGRRASPARR